MDREILFRGKTKDGRWVYGDLVRRLVETTWQDILGEYQFAIAGKGAREKTVDFKNKRAEVISCTTVDPATVGQYTGLCDKNGVKIFEGDVVKMVPDDNEEESWLTEVKFEDGAFRVEVNGCDYAYTAIGWIDDEVETQVIGNIHDTPDLESEEDEK